MVPVTVKVMPLGPSVGLTEIVAPGTECSAVAVAIVPATVAVTVLVDGMSALIGTLNVVSNLPEESGVTEIREVVPYLRFTL